MSLDIEKFIPEIQEAIAFLAPYFKINQRQLDTFQFPKISLSPDEYPYYDGGSNELLFNKQDHKNKRIIGHETAHYLHANLNNSLWEDGVWGLTRWGRLLIETTAYYAEEIYIKQGEIFKKPIISLPVLARKDYYFYSNKYSQRKLKSLKKELGIGIPKS